MPPTHPLPTPCRYGYNCTRPDCFYTHPKGMKKEHQRHQQQLCTFGRSCFRKASRILHLLFFKDVCIFEHPDGRMMDQLRPGIDYCAACALVRPTELPRVKAAFQLAFPAPDDGEDRCEFVAAVPMNLAFQDWKRYRGVSTTGTPDGVPSSLEKIHLFPRTRKGRQLLQDPANRSGLKWSPTPYRPWKMLERMVTHDQFWEENQDMYLLCAGYEATLPAKGVCIELSVTGVVTPEDDGDGTKAGTRVAGKVLGLPDAQGQKWFVFHLSRPEESDEGTLFVTVKAILDTTKMPMPYRRLENQPQSTRLQSSSVASAEFPLRSLSARLAGAPATGLPSRVSPIGTVVPVSSSERVANTSVMRRSTSMPTPVGVAHAPSCTPVSTDPTRYKSGLGFNSLIEEGTPTTGSPSPTSSLSTVMGERTPPDRTHANGLLVAASLPPPAPPLWTAAVVYPLVGELDKLLAKLNMSKYRKTLDDKKVDYESLVMMKEEKEISGLGIPLGKWRLFIRPRARHRLDGIRLSATYCTRRTARPAVP
ncbi:unnamed protein product [Ascophyllum nodosum]